MKFSKLRSRIFGTRIFKTALSVFLTALICEWLNWPPVFAVITAIVTVEPTVAASIKKGIVRFPASAIGSLYAVFFIFLFGNSPITYTLAAFFTIFTCFRLHLHAGLLVATLTSVAMIEVIHDNLLISFLIRLGTTTVGLLVSTAVNMFILPPNYTKKIISNNADLLKRTGIQLELIMKQLVKEGALTGNRKEINSRFSSLKKLLDQTEVLLQFQEAESKYHRLNEHAKNVFQLEQTTLARLRMVHYHIGNLVNAPIEYVEWSKEESEEITKMVETLADYMKDPAIYKASAYRQQVKQLMDQFWETKKPSESDFPSLFTPEVIILYELLSIYHIVEDILEDEQAIAENSSNQ